MSPESQPDPETNPEMPDHEIRLRELAAELEIPEGALSDRGIGVATELLGMHWREHGDKSQATYKPYHDGEHPVNVIRRGWRLLKILDAILPGRVDQNAYEDMMLVGAGHDVVNKPGAPVGQNERESGEITGQLMAEAGYGHERIRNVQEDIEATTVKRDEQGVISQTNIRRGSRRLVKFAAAEADINGIIMEGVPTMINDAFNLYLEINKVSLKDVMRNPAKAADFFRTQAQFLENRLADVDGDLSYYFSDDEKALIQEVYQHEFSGLTREALGTARMLFRFSRLPEEIIRSALAKTEDAASSGSDRLSLLKRNLLELLTRTHK